MHRFVPRTFLGLTLATVFIATVSHAQAPAPSTAPQPGGQGRRGQGIRGTVVSASASSVTLKNDDGKTWTVVATDNTRVMRDRQPIKTADFQAGDEAVAMGIPEENTHQLHAFMIMGMSATQVAKAKADLGKTYIVGRITAIQDTSLTVLRPDKVSQTIQLDESTSLRRGGHMPAEAAGMMGMGGGPRGGGAGGDRRREGAGAAEGATPSQNGEAITLADVKVGDNVGGIGGMKGSSFVPTELHVMRPRGPRSGGPPNAPAGTPSDSQQN